jgi:signal peptidase II
LTKRYLVPLLVAATVVGLDAVTKRYAATAFADADVVVIPGFLSFTYVENPGAAFSLFQNFGQVLGVAAIVVTAIVLWSLRRPRPTMEVVAFGLIIGGAVGNLIDRVTRGEGLLDGKVVDWVNLWWIPTFNIADMAVTFAVTLLLIHAWRTRQDS